MERPGAFSKRRKAILRIATWGLLASAASPCCAAVVPAHALVDVGAHRLDVVRAGTGGPAVVFETGLADSLDTWAPFVQVIGESTTAIAYSRAGFGRSDAGSGNHSAAAEVADLHELLKNMGLPPPYVLVGRSYGGMLMRLYTSFHPAEVAGLVLVDGTHEGQVQRYGMLDPKYPAQFRSFFDSLLRTLPPGPQAAEIRETMRIQAAGKVEGMKPLPDVPIAVLTSMKSDSAAAYVNGTARGHEAWRELHDEWFRRSRNGIHIETSRSGHNIQDTEPALVIQAIRFVVDRVRAR